LPRQFHTAIVENNKETHIRTAIWLFSVVPTTFQPFVFPSWGGNILLKAKTIIQIPILDSSVFDNVLTVMVFLGGFSAAISMIIVSSISSH
jgi:hypothetical protein